MNPNPHPPALILGGHFISLGAARSLSKHDVPVFILEHELCMSRFSRHVESCIRCPSLKVKDGENELIAFLKCIATSLDLDGGVLIPSTDETVRVAAMYRNELMEHFRMTTPDWSIVRFFYDKRLTHQLAVQEAVPTPETFCPGDEGRLASLSVEFPVVIKPAITTHLIGKTGKKAYRVNDREQLVETFRKVAAVMDPAEILVQELIPGRADNLYSYFGFFKHGKPVRGYAAKRPRQYPMDFGKASTLAVTVNLPELEQLATRLLSGIDYTGLAEVEFMFNPRHGRFELLEVNPRIWGWHTLAIHAGVDLLYLAYTDAIGKELGEAEMGNFRDGAKWMRLLTDVPAVAGEMWHGRMTLGQYLHSVQGCTDAVFSLSDPLPFFAEILLIPLLKRRMGV